MLGDLCDILYVSFFSNLQLLIKDVSDGLISQRVVPALVTLANDPDMSVRIATIPSLGGIIENITTREVSI